MLDILGLKVSTSRLINVILYLAFVFVIYLVCKRILRIVFERAGGRNAGNSAHKQRVKTISQLLSSLLRYLMLILVLLAVLAVFGVNVSSLIAGLGIMTAILGLAFQDMLKDFIAGVAIITEDQFSVGDTVKIENFKGTVINISLKTTEIRDGEGRVKIISNRNIDGIINYSKKGVAP